MANLHDELERLVAAGLAPAEEALRSATLEGARLMRRVDMGQVKAGFIADLVILRGDPLENVRNTRAIENVIVRGKSLGHWRIAR